ncbi:MAG TPA: nuclear transport factor 2 family protein [Terriglobales bacterium]|jgi:hypothetical protein
MLKSLQLAIFASLLLCPALLTHAQEQSTANRKNIEVEIKKREHALSTAEHEHNSAAFKQLLRNDLIYVAFNGWVFTKADLISKMKYIDVDEYDTENIKVRLPNPHAALITYDLKAKATIAGHDLPKKQYVSSLWIETGGKWELLFHQATPDTHP